MRKPSRSHQPKGRRGYTQEVRESRVGWEPGMINMGRRLTGVRFSRFGQHTASGAGTSSVRGGRAQAQRGVGAGIQLRLIEFNYFKSIPGHALLSSGI